MKHAELMKLVGKNVRVLFLTESGYGVSWDMQMNFLQSTISESLTIFISAIYRSW